MSLAAAVALSGTTAAAHAEALMPKQLAGPPSEFAVMRAPDPAESAIQSKSALLPVEMTRQKSGRLGWSGTLPVENGSARFLLLTADGAGWQVGVADPFGRAPRSLGAMKSQPTRFGTGEHHVPAIDYRLAGVATGLWTLSLAAEPGAPQQGFILVEGDARTELTSHLAHRRQLVGEQIGVVAMLSSALDDGIALGNEAGRVHSAELRVTYPDGSVRHFAMHDDGLHGDGAAGDGVWGGRFPAEGKGMHLAQVVVHGEHTSGAPLLRTAEHLIPVVERSLMLGRSKSARGATSADGRLQVMLPVTAEKSAEGRHYRAFAEVWGHDARGRALPVAWIGGMVEADGNWLGLGLDERWIAKAGARAPFELRNLRIEDPDHFVTIADADRVPLSLPRQYGHAKRAGSIDIDETMLMGPRPAALATKSTGSRLLLVHGYCSGGVWPTSHFSNASTFLDVNRSRSHDEFARLIRDFGASWNSFGVVAHSQGGAAALHLYTYYWSGLDRASGNRLIQSVGTPYQGTNLAGILAAVGSWFGVGCGSNDNLTYNGARAWLSGIPTWARAKVNYYTTSFATAWWRYDYCHMATDIVLSDPEDGTTEQVNGQLPGAVNRGHTTGQCHTANMRDPAQYLDASRNSVMNSNAAR